MVILTIYGWNLITHSNFRWVDGKDGALYRNFAVTFSFLDWMFATLHIPDGRPWKYGVTGKEPHWAEGVFYPLVRMPKEPKNSTTSTAEGPLPQTQTDV